jgi:dTDP-4-dehydrorhamnose reductase
LSEGTKRRLLLTGATGLLGAAIVESWANSWQISALGRRPIGGTAVENLLADLNEPSTLAPLVERARPEVVVHCAAWTDLDGCEADPARARTIHRDATAALASAAAQGGARFVYISTDSVFGGERGPHREEDPTDPRSVYARTKLEGEDAALHASAGSALVVRTCIIGWNAQPKTSLAEWVLRELRGGRSVKGFTDISFTPILTTTLARALERLVGREARGLLHVGGADCITKYDFAVKVADVFSLPRSLIVPTSIAEAKLAAPRPRCPCLNSSRYAALSGEPLETVDQALIEMRHQEATGFRDRLRALIPG